MKMKLSGKKEEIDVPVIKAGFHPTGAIYRPPTAAKPWYRPNRQSNVRERAIIKSSH